MTKRWFSEPGARADVPARRWTGRSRRSRRRVRARRELCQGMKHEWRFLHDLMAESMLGLVTYIQQTLGDEDVAEAWSEHEPWLEARHRPDRRAATAADRGRAGRHLARALSGASGRTRALHDRGGRREIHLPMNPCGSGQRLWRNGAYEGESPGVTREAHDWSYGRKGFPLYCTHCSFMNECCRSSGTGSALPSDPPEDYDRDPCTWYWYKDPADIPDRHWDRYGPTSRSRRV